MLGLLRSPLVQLGIQTEKSHAATFLKIGLVIVYSGA